MAKLSLNTINTLSNVESKLNNNFELIEEALENTLSRDGTTPNQLTADLDVNLNNLLNVDTLNAQDVTVAGVSISDNVDAAADSAAAAAVSETNAAVSETNAAASATAASDSADLFPSISGDAFIQADAGGTTWEARTVPQVRTALNVEDGADVTDATNVTAAGALMDSELTNEAAIKALDQSVATGESPIFSGLDITSIGPTLAVTDSSNGNGVEIDSFSIHRTGASDFLSFGTPNYANTLSIKNGKVGIGDSDPQSELSVTGDADVTGSVTSSGGILGPLFADRAALVSASIAADIDKVSHLTPAGKIVCFSRYTGGDATKQAVSTNGGTVHWTPAYGIHPQHFGDNTTPGTTDMKPAIQAALDCMLDTSITNDIDLYSGGPSGTLDLMGEHCAIGSPIVIGDVNGTGAGFGFGINIDNGTIFCLSSGTWTDLESDVPGSAIVIADWLNVDITDSTQRLHNITLGHTLVIDCNWQTGGVFWENTRNCKEFCEVLNVGIGAWGHQQSIGAAVDNARGVKTVNTGLEFHGKVQSGNSFYGGGKPLVLDGICTLQTPDGMNELAIDGSEASGGSWTSPTGGPHILEIRSSTPYQDGDGTVEVDIDGTSDGVTPLSETVTLRRNSTQWQVTYSTNAFQTVTSVSTNGNHNGDLSLSASMQNGGYLVQTADCYMTNVEASQMSWAMRVEGNGAVQTQNCHLWSREVVIGQLNFWTSLQDTFFDFTDVRISTQASGAPIYINGRFNVDCRLVLVADQASADGASITVGQLTGGIGDTHSRIELEAGAGSWANFEQTKYSVSPDSTVSDVTYAKPLARAGSDAEFHVDWQGHYIVGNNQATGGAGVARIRWESDDFQIVPTDQSGGYNFDSELRYRFDENAWVVGAKFPSGTSSPLICYGDLTVNGADLFVDTSLGRVGFGTASPLAPSHVEIAGAGDIQSWSRADTGQRWSVKISANDYTIKDSTGGVDVMTLANATGDVGIGKTPSTKLDVDGPIKPKSYTVAGLPNASTEGAGAMIYVSDETGGAVIAFSDGTDWRRVTDRAVVS